MIYKEGRDIVEENEISYTDAVKNLDQGRLAFRELNRKLRLASFETLADFQDEYKTMQQVEQESIIAAWLRVSIFETFLWANKKTQTLRPPLPDPLAM